MVLKLIAVKTMSALEALLQLVFKVPILGHVVNIALCSVAMFTRFGKGGFVAAGVDKSNRPRKTLILYQYEACPFCRRVREAFSVLALDYINYPCPRLTLAKYGVVGDSRFRPEALALSGKAQFPVLVDPNYDPPLVITESTSIVKHLWSNYGNAATEPLHAKLADTSLALLALPSLFRPLPEHGLLQTPSRLPPKMLELFQFEVSPFCKMIREKLDSMEIPYLVRNLPKGSSGRAEYKARFGDKLSALRKAAGLVMVPLLLDPNTDTSMVESTDILAYLETQYGVEGARSTANWSEYSTAGSTASHGTIGGRTKEE